MQIALFVPCYIDQFAPQVALATARILERLGHEVVVPPGQTCCGQPTYNTGYWDETRAVARHFLRVFADYETIVAPSGGCVGMVSQHYPTLFAGWPEAAQVAAMAERVHEFTSFLVDTLGVTDLGAALEAKVTVHDSCHPLRELGIHAQPRALLRAVAGLTLLEMPQSDTCCGFGGAFSVKYPEISTAMADEKLTNALSTGADILTGVESSCLLHLQGRIDRQGHPIQTMHIAELLAGGGGGPPPPPGGGGGGGGGPRGAPPPEDAPPPPLRGDPSLKGGVTATTTTTP
jgi:L-lactate dehydrogenase complex protein LldE